MYLTHRPKKGEAFRLYFSADATYLAVSMSASRIPVPRKIAFSSVGSFSISKNGSAFGVLTNVPVEISTGIGYIDLTAEEMNNDVIQFRLTKDPSSWSNIGQEFVLDQVITIYTTTETASGITPEQIWSYENRELTSPVIVDFDSTITDIQNISATNPTMREVLSLLWLALTQTASKKGWSFKKWVNRFNW